MKTVLALCLFSCLSVAAYSAPIEKVEFNAVVTAADFSLQYGCSISLQNIEFVNNKLPSWPFLDQLYHSSIIAPVINGHECALSVGDEVHGILALYPNGLHFESI